MKPLVIIVFLLAFTLFPESYISQDIPVLKVEVPLVAVDVAVFDSVGRPIGNLTKSSFRLLEDGLEQAIAGFDDIDVPFSTLLLFDCSDSTRAQWSFLNDAVRHFLTQQRPRDKSAVALFGSGVRSVNDWGHPVTELDLEDRPGICKGATTEVYGTLEWALDRLQRVEDRKALILLTDGIDNQLPLKEVSVLGSSFQAPVDIAEDERFQRIMSAVSKTAVRIYVVAVDTDLNPAGNMTASEMVWRIQARSRLQRLAEVSGGRLFIPERGTDLIDLYQRISEELGTSYTLSYISKGQEDTHHRIEVLVDGDGLSLRQSRDAIP